MPSSVSPERAPTLAGLGPEELLALHRDMALLRTFDEQAVAYRQQGRLFCSYAIHWGHEAMQAGAVRALAPDDWVFPSYRETAVGLLRGIPIETVLSWLRGEPAGSWDPYESCVANICVPVGTHVPHAVGFAWGSRLKDEDTCALAFFGDGATSEGAFHEGLTFAGVVDAPVVLLCNNNSWAISTPVSAQTGAQKLVDKAIGYGIEGVRVDGGSVLEVYEAVRNAVKRARAGGGATFIEAVTYRMAPHATADDPSLYWDEGRVAAERQRECLTRYEKQLQDIGVMTEGDAERVRDSSRDAVRAAMAVVEERPTEPATVMFDGVYSEPLPCFAEDRDAVAREDDLR